MNKYPRKIKILQIFYVNWKFDKFLWKSKICYENKKFEILPMKNENLTNFLWKSKDWQISYENRKLDKFPMKTVNLRNFIWK